MLATVVCLAIPAGVIAQTAAPDTVQSATASKKTKKPRAKSVQDRSLQEQIDELRVSMQTQIDTLKQQLAERDAQLQALQQAAQTAALQATVAAKSADAANAKAVQSAADVQTLTPQVAAASTNAVAAVKAVADTAKQSPVAIRYKNVTITPKGFLAAEAVWRERAMNTDILTPFNATPYMNAGEARISEFDGTARQSQLGLLVQGSIPFGKLTGYVETDFLGVGANSSNTQSNSYTLRLRQGWAQIARGGFTFTGGQMWSLVTETKHGAAPGTEAPPQVVDPAYLAGFSWARQYGIRATQQLPYGVTLAASVEQSQILFSAAGTTTVNMPTNFFFGGAGTGDFNPAASYSDNVAPDLIVKATYDPGFGHFELGGITRFFRDRYYPGGTATNASNHSETGGGLIFNARVPATKYLDIGVHVLSGEGVGRYGASGLPDVTVKPSGTLEPLRGDQGLLTLIAHPTPELDLFGFAGGEYVQRTVYRNAANTGFVGYAPPDANNASCNTESLPTGTTGTNPGTGNATTCTGATRAILSGTVGWTYRFYNGSRGKLQYSMFYTYLTREAWAGLNGTSPTAAVAAPKATNNMIYTGFRYYLP
jgi:hypothetical protein